MANKRDSLKGRNTSVEALQAPRHSGRSTIGSGTATPDRLYRVGKPQVN